MAQKRQRLAASKTATATKYHVWELLPPVPFPGGAVQLGYLVAPDGDPNHPIAMAVTPGGHEAEEALSMAFAIASDPGGTWETLPRGGSDEDAFVIDLTARGDSDPVQPWLFCACAWRINNAGKRLHRHPVELFPLCPRRMPAASQAGRNR